MTEEDNRLLLIIRSTVEEMLRALSDRDRAEWLTTHQAANLLQICPTSLEKARSTGVGPLATIPHHKIGRSVRYRRADVLDAVARLRVPGRATRT
ncbi:protein of unassigned function [Methylobacterium oryzae CBMB20]|uniref:Protein of unassigned function n=1 Tax=Methylobacterium oryzae CBMB20 TaxID=693986 RepID=A0A089Q9Y8_9HYPH|nr:protein of unassigned function [Methylobacterium oryzae CBMB20]